MSWVTRAQNWCLSGLLPWAGPGRARPGPAPAGGPGARTATYPADVVNFLIAVLPSAGVLFIFWLGIRALLEADRRERTARARIEAEQDAAARRPGAGDDRPAAG